MQPLPTIRQKQKSKKELL
jgi:hypothetical protein